MGRDTCEPIDFAAKLEPGHGVMSWLNEVRRSQRTTLPYTPVAKTIFESLGSGASHTAFAAADHEPVRAR